MKCGKINISDYSFLRLLVSSIILKKQNPIIKNHQLAKKLYDFYDRKEYHFLFEDICKKEDIVGENNYVDLNCAYQQAYAFGLILQIHDCHNELKSIINISIDEAKLIQSQYSQEQIEAISNMCDEIFGLKKVEIQDDKKHDFDVLAVPCDRAFVVSPDKTEAFLNVKPNPEIRQQQEEMAKIFEVNNLVNDGPILKKVRKPDKK